MVMNVTPFVGTDNFNMETFNNMISQINSGVNSEISDVLAQLGTKAKIQTGSYVGTGTYGASNPCSLTFDGMPCLLIVTKKGIGLLSNITLSGWDNGVLWHSEVTQSQVVGNNQRYIFFTQSQTILSWYSDSADCQLNSSGVTYQYTCILHN